MYMTQSTLFINELCLTPVALRIVLGTAFQFRRQAPTGISFYISIVNRFIPDGIRIA
jgi:hypothetical protein